MDSSEGECSATIPAKEKEEIPENTETTTRFDEFNGSCFTEIGDLGSGEHVEVKTSTETNGNEIRLEKLVETPSKTNESPSAVSGGTTPTTKGYGLKKWRRIRRGFTKEGGNSVDFNRILKRGLTNAAEPTRPPRELSVEIKQKSEGSVASANSSAKSPSAPSVSAVKSLTSESRLAAGSAFPFCTDSENSEDRSSKSSTAASAPKLRYDAPSPVMGSTREKGKVKNPSGKNSGNAVQRGHHGTGRIETSKKLRGEKIKVETENSYSSVESDSRSSYFVFAQMENLFGISNGGQNQKSSNYNGQNSKGAHISELQSSKEVQTECFNENGGEVEGVLQDDVAADVSWEVKEEEGDNHRLTEDGDPLAESILSLQAVQETLEREIQKFVDIGLDHVLLPDDFIPGHGLPVEFTSVDPEVHEPNSSGQMCFEEIKISGSPPLEAQFVELKQKVNLPESNLEESSAILKTKESGVVEVDAILHGGETLKGESGSSLKSLQEKCREMEIELEGLFKQKFEAEVEYLVITRTTQKFKIAAEDQVLLLDEQKSLAGEQNQLLPKLRDVESKAVLLKRQAEKLDASCGELLGTEEVLKMQNRVCKFTLCFVVQLILLFVAFGMFLLHLLPHSTGFVPT